MSIAVETTQKGFKVIHVTWKQAIHWGGAGICDWCNEIPQTGTYIGVLNHYYCPACYDEWHKRATFYPEDQPFEQKMIDNMVERLNHVY